MTARSCRSVRALGVAVAIALVATAPGEALSSEPPRCSRIAFASDLESDAVGFCTYKEPTASGTATPILFYVSRDRGVTWEQSEALGLPTSSLQDAKVHVSPLYEDDRTVYVETGTGLYASNDEGATFTLIDRLGFGVLTPFVIDSPHIAQGRRTAFVTARSELSALIDPPFHQLVAGSPARDRVFFVPQDFAESGEAYVLSSVPQDPGHNKTILYLCTSLFVCEEELFSFPLDQTYQGDAWIAPDFAASKHMYVVTQEGLSGHHAWVSKDGGQSFKPWRSVNKEFDRITRYNDIWGIDIATHPRFPNRMYMHLGAAPDDDVSSPSAAPTFQVFESRNRGRTWKTLGSSVHWLISEGQQGTLPWNDGSTAPFDEINISMASDGRLIALASQHRSIQDSSGRDRLFCSTDWGRSWTSPCPES